MISKIKLQHITTMSKWFLVPEMSILVYINNILDFHLSYSTFSQVFVTGNSCCEKIMDFNECGLFEGLASRNR